MAGIPSRLFAKLDEPLEATKIKVKLKATCTQGPKKVEQDKKRRPIVVRHVQTSTPQINDLVKPARPSNLPITPRSSCRTPSPPPPLTPLSPRKIISSQVGCLTKHHSTPSLNRVPSPSRERSFQWQQPRSRPSSPTNVSGRRTPSPAGLLDSVTLEKVKKRIKRVQKARLYLLRQPGPYSFLVVGDSSEHKYKVIIGPQTCSCGKGPHCLHLLFVMVRVLQLKDTDPRLSCKQLKNYEVEELIHQYNVRKNRAKAAVSGGNNTNHSDDRSRNEDDNALCPICLLEMVEGESLVTCEWGCHNKLHHHCISIWAEECLRQNEAILCPLCRAKWPFPVSSQLRLGERTANKTSNTPQKEITTHSLSPACHCFSTGLSPLKSDIPLPRAENLSESHLKDAVTWVQVYGKELVNCLFSRSWVIRETALKRLAREIASILSLSQENPDPGGCRGALITLYEEQVPSHETAIEVCCQILTRMISDPVYKVYIACLRCVRSLLAHSSCKTDFDLVKLRDIVCPIIRKILLRCVDGNRRTCQLSIATLIEMVRGQAGALAVGTQTRYPAHCGLGGIEYILDIILEEQHSNSISASWTWFLGRLYVLERLIEEFPQDFYLLYVHLYPPAEGGQCDIQRCGYKLLNYERMMSLLRFTSTALEHGHPTVSKMAQKVFVMASRLSAHVPSVFSQIYDLVHNMNLSLRLALIRKLDSVVHDLTNPSLHHHQQSNKHPSNCSSSRRSSATKFHSLHTMVSQRFQERTLVTEKLITEMNSCSQFSNRTFGSRSLCSSSYNPSRRQNVKTESNVAVFPRHQSLCDVGTRICDCQHRLHPSYLPLSTNCGNSELSPHRQTVSSCAKPCKTYCSLVHCTKNQKNKEDNSESKLEDRSTQQKISANCDSFCISCKDRPSHNAVVENCTFISKDLNLSSHKNNHIASTEKLALPSVLSSNFEPLSFSEEISSPLSPKSLLLGSSGRKEMAKTVGSSNKIRKAIIEESATLKFILEKVKVKDLPTVPGLGDEVKKSNPVIFKEENEAQDSYVEGVHWVKGHILGTGAFSSCYQARDIKTGTLMAVKQVSFCRNSEEEQQTVMEAISEEIVMMVKLDHPNILRLFGATQQGNHYNVFIEWMAGGSVAALLERYGPFSESVIVWYTYQVLDGLSYLHDNQILHRDLKGANLLVDSTGHHLRIADFGAAAHLTKQNTMAGEFQGQLLGTIAFMAPEVLRGEDYGRSCDVWSVGCVMIEMATTKPPWNAHDVSNHLALIFKIACSKSHPPIPEHLSPETRDIALKCLDVRSEVRPAAKELLHHPSFQSHFLEFNTK